MTTDTEPGSVVHDPMSRRLVSCAIWFIGYGLVWWFKFFQPLPHVAWVNFAVIGAILAGTLPPARVRPFSAAAALLGLAAIMWFVMHNQLLAIVLGITGLLALADGVFDVRKQRSASRA